MYRKPETFRLHFTEPDCTLSFTFFFLYAIFTGGHICGHAKLCTGHAKLLKLTISQRPGQYGCKCGFKNHQAVVIIIQIFAGTIPIYIYPAEGEDRAQNP